MTNNAFRSTNFPYYGMRIENNGRISQFVQATSTQDIRARELVASWALQVDRGAIAEVELYWNEVVDRNIVTEPVTGDQIRAYEVARNLIELYDRGGDWVAVVDFWLTQLAILVGFDRDNLYLNPSLAGGTDIVQNVGTAPTNHALVNYGLADPCNATKQPDGTYIFNPGTPSTARLAFGQTFTNLTVGRKYRCSAEVRAIGEGTTARGLNANSVTGVEVDYTYVNTDVDGVWRRIWVDLVPTAETNTLQIRHGTGLIAVTTHEQQSRDFRLFDRGPAIPLNALYDPATNQYIMSGTGPIDFVTAGTPQWF